MNQLFLAFGILSGVLALSLLFGGYLSLAESDNERKRSIGFEMIDGLFGGIFRAVENWPKKSESRLCFYLGAGFGMLAIILLMLHKA